MLIIKAKFSSEKLNEERYTDQFIRTTHFYMKESVCGLVHAKKGGL